MKEDIPFVVWVLAALFFAAPFLLGLLYWNIHDKYLLFNVNVIVLSIIDVIIQLAMIFSAMLTLLYLFYAIFKPKDVW